MWRGRHLHYGAYGGSTSPGKWITTGVIYSTLRNNLYRLKNKDVSFGLTGIIFGRAGLPFVRDQILPHVKYWHHRSAKWVDFFTAGFGAAPDEFSE